MNNDNFDKTAELRALHKRHKYDLTVIWIVWAVCFVVGLSVISNYYGLPEELPIQPDIGCITDAECGCIDDCLEPAISDNLHLSINEVE